MTQQAAVYYERAEEHIGRIVLNRPDNRNSMTPELLDAFHAAAQEAAADGEVRCVVVVGTGRSFSAGADFRSAIQRDDDADGPPRQPHERSYAMYVPFLSVLDIEVPVIGALNGHAVGGGFGLSLVCDLRVASTEGKYGANFARLGLHSGMAVSYLLPRLVGPTKAAELLFTGRLVEGDEAERLGLVNRAVSPDEVEPTAMELAREIASNAPVAVRMMKRSFYEGLGWDVRGSAHREAMAQAVTVQTDDASEGMAALLDKRTPEFRGG